MTTAAPMLAETLVQPVRDGIPTQWIDRDRAAAALRHLKEEIDRPYRMLYDLTAIDERMRTHREGQPASDFTVVYKLFSFDRNSAERLPSLLSLPGLGDFAGEALILFGTFPTHPLLAAGMAVGVLLATLYGLRLIQRTFQGPNFGMALVFGELGTMEVSQIGARIRLDQDPVCIVSGMALILTGVGFKLGVVPFHSLEAGLVSGLSCSCHRISRHCLENRNRWRIAAFVLCVIRSDCRHRDRVLHRDCIDARGKSLALLQTNVKRILAYFSIAHFGYILVPFLAANDAGIEAASFYVAAYSLSTLGAFGMVSLLSTAERDADRIE